MNGKNKNNLPILLCLIMLIPLSTIGIFLTYIFSGLMGNTTIGYVIGYLIVGCVAAFPILTKIDTEKRMQRWKRYLIKAGVVVLFSVMAFAVLVLMTAFRRFNV